MIQKCCFTAKASFSSEVSMSQQKIYLVGAGIAGWEGFGSRALEVIAEAEVLIGHQRHLDNFPDFSGEKQELEDLSVMLEFLRTTEKRAVVLGSGDPNFFGIGRFLLRNLPKDRIEIFPNVTSVQYAFARIKEPWDDAVFVSVHGRGLGKAIDRIIAAEKIAVLTDKVNTPAAIAKELIERGAEGYDAWLCENMGLPDEKFTKTDLKGLQTIAAAELNILILIKAWEPNLVHYPLIGIDDDEFATVKKLITKQEVRAVTLAKLQLQDDFTIWDIGAGSGSISIEASNLVPNGKLFAIEIFILLVAIMRTQIADLPEVVTKPKGRAIHKIEAVFPRFGLVCDLKLDVVLEVGCS